MRFEIRTGGAFAILIGLGLLSGSVFLLGLVAGYEMGRQQEGNHQFASVYPLPPAPAAASSPATGTGTGTGIEAAPAPAAPIAEPPPLAAVPTPEVAPAPAVAAVPAPVATAPVATAAPAIAAPGASAAIASAPVEPARPPIARSSTTEGSAAHGEPEISSPVSQHHRGYSIQIEAVMDKSGADGMVAKLRHLGYEGYLVETLIGGETWYRVRIGPFPTEAEAQSAEQKLHADYTGAVAAP